MKTLRRPKVRKTTERQSDPANSAPIMSSSAARLSRCTHCGEVAEHERFTRDTRDCKSCFRRFHTRPTPRMVLADLTPYVTAGEVAAVLQATLPVVHRFIRLVQLGPDARYDRGR